MENGNPLCFQPANNSQRVQDIEFAGDTERAAGAQNHEHIAQDDIEGGSGQLGGPVRVANGKPRSLPMEEMRQPGMTPMDGFRSAGASRGKKDVSGLMRGDRRQRPSLFAGMLASGRDASIRSYPENSPALKERRERRLRANSDKEPGVGLLGHELLARSGESRINIEQHPSRTKNSQHGSNEAEAPRPCQGHTLAGLKSSVNETSSDAQGGFGKLLVCPDLLPLLNCRVAGVCVSVPDNQVGNGEKFRLVNPFGRIRQQPAASRNQRVVARVPRFICRNLTAEHAKLVENNPHAITRKKIAAVIRR